MTPWGVGTSLDALLHQLATTGLIHTLLYIDYCTWVLGQGKMASRNLNIEAKYDNCESVMGNWVVICLEEWTMRYEANLTSLMFCEKLG